MKLLLAFIRASYKCGYLLDSDSLVALTRNTTRNKKCCWKSITKEVKTTYEENAVKTTWINLVRILKDEIKGCTSFLQLFKL